MAKVQIKSEKLTPFGGIFSIMEQFDSKGQGTGPCATRRTSIYKGLATFHIRCSRNCQ